MLENMLQMSGVQSILKNLVAAAAPQLVEQANQIGDTIRAFKDAMDRIEANQKLIMSHMGLLTIAEQKQLRENLGENHDVGRTDRGIAEQSNGAGKQTG
jgi:hypothetical protein